MDYLIKKPVAIVTLHAPPGGVLGELAALYQIVQPLLANQLRHFWSDHLPQLSGLKKKNIK